ncbi:hypothetical protein GUITHDRAFT_108018 [Guillardia theta CCMP2712]|uniref:Uncharacterized protein n=1 Tax=Guillardia theta (strain CCMP2712) TaxID=905079 RepID=L1JBR3_GUITC|nr:hypothetical protein GUITHDRAFT_108018 [Guillardia theta CCMP2712]EKX45978.1 hypothetical protein GUITHDRAFT_108018 [Guillardia theta CCMP2712]|eukprot:XP_005832958.1 hypothetical protein GUITHDRAFT_108018 [Guillardia theta CCMP2712]
MDLRNPAQDEDEDKDKSKSRKDKSNESRDNGKSKDQDKSKSKDKDKNEESKDMPENMNHLAVKKANWRVQVVIFVASLPSFLVRKKAPAARRYSLIEPTLDPQLPVSGRSLHCFIYRLDPPGVVQEKESQVDQPRSDEFSALLHQAIHNSLSSQSHKVWKIYPGKTYLDVDCMPLLLLEETRTSKAKYLCNCSIFVPLISWGSAHSVLDDLACIHFDGAIDQESHFLVHALCAIYLLQKKAGRLQTIMPITRDESRGKVSMAEACRRLSTKPSIPSCKRACVLLQEGGVEMGQGVILSFLLGISVRDAVMMLMPSNWREEALPDWEPAGGLTTKNSYSLYNVKIEGNDKVSASEAAEMIVDCLVKVLKEHVEKKLWEFTNHNPRGIELLKLLRESGIYDKFDKYFALRGIESLHQVPSFTRGSPSNGSKREQVVHRPCSDITAYNASDEGSIRALERLVEDHRDDERFLPLQERLNRYRDSEVDGILALRTTNSIETAMVKLPARCCVLWLSMVYLVFGINQLGPLFTEQIWLPEKNSTTPVQPKTVRIAKVAAPVISFYWSFLFVAGVIVGQVSTPLRAKWLMLFAGHLVIAGNVFSFIVDSIQCSVEGTGIGPNCNAYTLIPSIAVMSFVMYLAHRVQHYFWMAAFFLQGLYCFYCIYAFPADSVDLKIGLGMCLFLAIGCCFIAIAIIVQYRRSYRQTLRELQTVMQGFDDTWQKIEEENKQSIAAVSVQAREIAQELQAVVKEDFKTWGRWLSAMAGWRRARYSTTDSKIRQESRDIEKLFQEAQEISAAFQLWVSAWNQVGRVQHGNVKSCARAIQKTVRSYGRDPSCLTDLVRCTILVQSMEEVQEWLSCFRRISVVGYGVSARDRRRASDVAPEDVEMGGREIFMSVTSIKNRYDPRYDARLSGGYRDMCICVGWTIDEASQTCMFVPVREWGKMEVRKHICEIQVLLEVMQGVKKVLHKEYVNFRNIMCQ